MENREKNIKITSKADIVLLEHYTDKFNESNARVLSRGLNALRESQAQSFNCSMLIKHKDEVIADLRGRLAQAEKALLEKPSNKNQVSKQAFNALKVELATAHEEVRRLSGLINIWENDNPIERQKINRH